MPGRKATRIAGLGEPSRPAVKLSLHEGASRPWRERRLATWPDVVSKRKALFSDGRRACR